MKPKNRVKRLKARRVEYDTMLAEANVMQKVLLEKSYRRPGSLKK